MGQNEKERSAGRVAANDNRLNRARRASGAADRTEVVGTEKKMAAMISAIKDGSYVKGMSDRLRELEARQEELKERPATVPSEIPDIHPNIAGVYRRKVARLAEALVKPEERDAAASAIRGLIKRIVLISGDKWGEMHATLRGDLGAVLEWVASGTEKEKTGTPAPRPTSDRNPYLMHRNLLIYRKDLCGDVPFRQSISIMRASSGCRNACQMHSARSALSGDTIETEEIRWWQLAAYIDRDGTMRGIGYGSSMAMSPWLQ